MPSLPSSAMIRSTKARAGSREVCMVTIMWQSTTLATRRDAAFVLGDAQVHQFQRAFQDVGVRVLLEGHQHVGVVHHRLAQVVVRVELGADHHLGPDDGAHALQQVAFAVVVAVGHHRAVQAEQHHVHRQARPAGRPAVLRAAPRRRRAWWCRWAARRPPCLRSASSPAACRAAARPTAGRRRSSCTRGDRRPSSSRARERWPCRWAWARRCWFRWPDWR